MPGNRRPPTDPKRPACRRGVVVPTAEAGFTLLEVLIAVAILAVSLSSLMGSQLSSMNATRYARDITVVALLAEHQIIDLEFRHRRDGWVNSDFKIEGDFSDEGYPDIKFSCVVHFIEMPEYNELLAGKEELDEAQGKNDDNVLDAGDRAFGALGMVWSIVKNAIENSIRKADCTVTWMQGKIEQEYTIETFWTDPAGLLQMPEAGGEFTDDDDPSGAGDDGSDSTGGRGGGRGGTAGPRPAFDGPGAGGMMGGRP